MKKIGAALLITIVVAGTLILLSPYSRHPHRGYAIIESIEIKASREQLFNYLGNSDNASEWSSYVDRIETLNEPEYADGMPGSRRRCFKKGSEDVTWDEVIVAVDSSVYRQLSIYNMKGFPIKSNALLTEQLYEAVDSSITRVSLTLYIHPEKGRWADHLKLFIASFKVGSVFEANLEKIKKINEG